MANGVEETNSDHEDTEGAGDAMATLDRHARAPVGFVAASTGPEGGNQPVSAEQRAAEAVNPDAIDIDDND